MTPPVASIRIQVVERVDDEIVAAMPRLVAQLSASIAAPGRAELERIVREPATRILVAREGRAILGMLTLALFRIPSGIRAWIEDVVVDADARGKGIGEALTREAIRLAAADGARTIELTSRPSREAANRLYQRLGFQRRETNVYRYTVEGNGEAKS